MGQGLRQAKAQTALQALVELGGAAEPSMVHSVLVPVSCVKPPFFLAVLLLVLVR